MKKHLRAIWLAWTFIFWPCLPGNPFFGSEALEIICKLFKHVKDNEIFLEFISNANPRQAKGKKYAAMTYS
jgi:hypothetical protein